MDRGKQLESARETEGGLGWDDFERALEKAHQALDEFVKGNPEPIKQTFSLKDDVTLANPFGGVLHGRVNVEHGLDRAAAAFSDGTYTHEEISRHASSDLAYVLEIERFSATLGGEGVRSGALRVTMVFRREDGTWKLVHRQADPLVDLQPLSSLTAH